ncbi:ead/Ea22-like family protein [Klebsiella pneumoniae]|uniref:hypothetical protein n=1 Tax=Klebsiella pneumoniae TaxID=573 RepID=UPI000DE66DF2|nr:hypothetical protein [Klebsiella pneumoniae]SSH31991.1 phage EaA protein [Klebsiella pneumoniae]
MTDITELAQSLKNAASKALIEEGLTWFSEEQLSHEDGIALHKADAEFIALANPANVLALVEALEKAQQVDEELCKLLPPGVEYMDPPDGGDVEPIEQVRRMVADYRRRIAELDAELEREREKSRRVMSRISELESRAVKLPKKNIGWDRDEEDCWNNAIDACAEVLAAAGIKVEAE